MWVKGLRVQGLKAAASGLPHWKDLQLEMEQKAALGNTKAEVALMRRYVLCPEARV